MKRLPFIALTALLGACANETPPPVAATPEAEPKIAIELVADSDPLRPGEPFQLTSRFTIEDGWHIYWEHPGDAGIPTSIELETPEGLRVGETRYSTPQRFESAGDIVTYGYEEEALLVTAIETDADASLEAPITIRASARWLACKVACVPGRATATIELGGSASTGDAPSPPVVARGTEPDFAKFPRTVSELDGAHLAWIADSTEPTLAVEVPGATSLDFYPSRNGSTRLEHQESNREHGVATLRLTFTVNPDHPDPPPASQGLLVVERDGDNAYYDVELPWPS